MSQSEIVLLMGPPGGGKSIQALRFVRHHRLNRDSDGGSLDQLHQELGRLLSQGVQQVVLDNVYATVESRKAVIKLGQQYGIPVRCVWLQTTSEQAQFLASLRQVRRYGRLLRSFEYKQAPYKTDPNMFPPAAQFAYWKRFEAPSMEEGFASLEKVDLQIDLGPEYINKAVIFDFDGTLRDTKSGSLYPKETSDIYLKPGVVDRLKEVRGHGWHILGASNQSGCARAPGHEMYLSEEQARACFDHTCQMIGVPIDYLFAPEAGGVPQSYWRKPCPGMGVLFIEKYKLHPPSCIFVGDLETDRTFAHRCGFQYADAEQFFSRVWHPQEWTK